MKDSLTDKMEAVQDEHFAEVEKSRLESFDQAFRDEALEFRGGLRAVTTINRSLSSKLIEGLMLVEDKKYYLAWGFKNFAEYLSSDEVSEISKNKYYDLKKLLLSEGSEAFDVFSGKKIPVTARKLLAAKGVQISIEGSDLVIDDQRVPVADKEAMRDLIETVHDALRVRDEREEKKDAKIEKLSGQLKQGQSDFEELQRSLDALNNADPFDRALSSAVYSILQLCENVGQLPDKKRKARGDEDAKLFANLWFRIRDAYGSTIALAEAGAEDKSAYDKKIDEILADGDLDDEGDD